MGQGGLGWVRVGPFPLSSHRLRMPHSPQHTALTPTTNPPPPKAAAQG